MDKIYIVGIGPGAHDQMTIKAMDVLKESQVIVGYTRYIQLIKEYTVGKCVYSTGMHGELERCNKAVEYAKNGFTTVVVSSGDSGVYGMAGLVFEIVNKEGLSDMIDVEVIPGVTAANSSAALLGAPIMHDYINISLSNWLTNIDLIEKRLHCAGEGDFVTVIYNPKSKKRPEIINKAQKILLEYKAENTPVGIVKNAYRKGQSIELTTLKKMCDSDIDMLSTVIVGNASTFISNNRMITPRGYEI